MRILRIPPSALSFIAILALIISIGSWGLELSRWRQGSETNSSPGTIQILPEGLPIEFEKLFEVWSALQRNHYSRDDLDASSLAEGSIRGMLAALDDPYAAYLDTERYELESDDFQGFFEGIGAEVTLRDGQITIVAPIPDTPADEAGIRPGDIIIEINGESAQGMSLQEAVSRIRGPRGESVDLVIFRKTLGEPINVSIERDIIEVTTVRLRMFVGRIAHLRITSFSDTTNQEVMEALQRMRDLKARGLVLDVRNNPGGILESVVNVTSQFIGEGLLLYEVDGNGQRRDWNARPGGLGQEIPLVLLVNEGSASGSEVLAGALMDYDRGPVIGAKTFGKGSVNTLRELRDGSGIYFTIARWFTPNGNLIEGEGLEPDIAVEQPEDGAEDIQLDRAVEILEENLALLQ